MRRTPDPARITMALNLAGLEGPQADIALGTCEPHVDLWEAGEEVPSDEQLARLAELAGLSVAFFYEPPLPPVTGYVCVRSGPGRRCSRVDTRPDADVIELHPSQSMLW